MGRVRQTVRLWNHGGGGRGVRKLRVKRGAAEHTALLCWRPTQLAAGTDARARLGGELSSQTRTRDGRLKGGLRETFTAVPPRCRGWQ